MHEIEYSKDYWRYHFAGLAMQGIRSHPDTEFNTSEIAHYAVNIVDALLAELIRKEKCDES